MRKCGFVIMAAVLLSFFGGKTGIAFDHTHSRYGDLLNQYVRDGLVNYEAFKRHEGQLKIYITELARVEKSEFNGWKQEERLAYLINLYNAVTLALVLEHYPVESIREIRSFLKGPWKQPVVPLFGKKKTLDYLEHKVMRKKYADPRIHFALVCAALGCPALRSEPYSPYKLEGQLEDQGRIFLRDTDKNYVDHRTQTLYLSPIFKWFKSDFKSVGGVQTFVAPYFDKKGRIFLRTAEYKIHYTRYNWRLNDSANAGIIGTRN